MTNDKIATILNNFPCIQCDGSGGFQTGEDEYEQCQFCYQFRLPYIDEAKKQIQELIVEETKKNLDWWKEDIAYGFVPLCSYCHRKTAKVVGQNAKGISAQQNNHRPVNWAYFCQRCYEEGMELEREAMYG